MSETVSSTVPAASHTATNAAIPASFPDPSKAQTYDNILDLVGNTPLVRLNHLTADLPGTVYVKLDGFNLGGSSKDRIGLNIIRDAIASGELRDGARVIEVGQGNTAIGLALAAELTGHPITFVERAEPTVSAAKTGLLRLLGAEIVPGRVDVEKDDPQHTKSIAQAREANDENTWWTRQGSIPFNPEAHVLSTGPEIWHQTQGRVTHFLAAIATGGTVSGTGTYLHEQNPDVRVIGTAFDLPDKPFAETHLYRTFTKAPGYEELEQDWQDNVKLDVIDELQHATKAEAIDFGWQLARREGVLVGITSALSIKLAVELAATVEPGSVIVAFSADSARDYLDTEYNAEWLREHGYAEIADRYDTRD